VLTWILIGLLIVLLVVVLVGLARLARDFDRNWPPADSKPLDPPDRFGDGGEA